MHSMLLAYSHAKYSPTIAPPYSLRKSSLFWESRRLIAAYGVNFTNPEINLSYAFLNPSTKATKIVRTTSIIRRKEKL